ncbi:hypothetical protein LVD15_08780 [Fulvivirga maritima]|uniref:hypothetical protein n=1 Tax=Fulvivirga maritima TaxID=2904247 RepID=UPI001F19797A|nr:hypothetical protein [Fulvivirga maritima]UII28509.1 hypothetical protein LVD15_08780 [Fulvivirga maritima]
MRGMVRLYKYFNLLSLDVAVGAVSCSLFVSKILGVRIPWPVTLILGLTVWLIYTFDHLVDARGLKHKASTQRHRFHQKYFKVLTIACAGALIVNAYLVFFLPSETVLFGIAISCLVMVYFLLLHFLKLKSVYHKELMIAVLYAAGIMVGPVSLYQGQLDLRIIIIFIQFVMIALSNLIVFSLYEKRSDQIDSFPSIVQYLNEKNVRIGLKVFILFQLALAVFISQIPTLKSFEYTFMFMLIILGALPFFRSSFEKNEKYRWVGDAIFLLPLITLLIGL